MARSHSTSPTQPADALAGKCIGLALDADADYSPAPALAQQSAELIYYPCEEMLPLDDPSEFDAAIQALADGEYDGLLLTTPDAVAALLTRLDALGLERDMLHKAKIAVYGADTQLALQTQLGINGSPQHTTDHAAFVAALDPQPGSRFLLPIPAGRTPTWTERLTAREARVTTVPAYRAHMRRDGDDLPGMLWAGSIDAMVFVSADNVQYFATRLRHDGATLAMLDHVTIACIDQSTANAAAIFGLHVALIAPDPTSESLAQALVDYFAAHPGG